MLAAEHPERIIGAAFIGPAVALAPPHPERTVHPFDEPLETDDGWAKYNIHHWLRDYRGFLEFFLGKCFTEPHSTKHIEDGIGWALETDARGARGPRRRYRPVDRRRFQRALRARSLSCARHARRRGCASPSCAGRGARRGDKRAARHTRGVWSLSPVAGPRQGQPAAPRLRQAGAARRPGWPRGRVRRKRALFISSPIGLGHAQRDAAIADELRKLHPDVEIDWLAQHPVTTVLEARGERIHPGSAFLANESHHIESESAEHDLHCFQAIRRMDEILLSNFMVFHDLVRDHQYDLWIGDEAWELDYYLHENPEEKRAPYAWLTDFVGWLPMPDGGDHEAFLTGDYNEEMIEHIARFPRVRDQAVFVGNAEDIVPERFAANLPWIRDWTEEHFSFAGYVTGFDPAEFADRAALRAELGYGEDEQVCIVTVGGSGVGGDLLRRVIAAFPEAKERVPALRMIVVAGPRIDPETLPAHEGLEVRAYVHDLYRHLAACDLAVVQGGLTTSMELTANRRPFLFFPLRHHFEQNVHVRHRLDRYGAGRRMDFEQETPETIAAAIAETVGQDVDYRPVESDGAARAAALIAPLLEEGKRRPRHSTAAI